MVYIQFAITGILNIVNASDFAEIIAVCQQVETILKLVSILVINAPIEIEVVAVLRILRRVAERIKDVRIARGPKDIGKLYGIPTVDIVPVGLISPI